MSDHPPTVLLAQSERESQTVRRVVYAHDVVGVVGKYMRQDAHRVSRSSEVIRTRGGDLVDQGSITLRQVVLDCTDARALAEFYRELLGLEYRAGDEPPAAGEPDVRGQDWLVLRHAAGGSQLAFQQVPALPEPTWPEGPRPQMLHLDLTVPSVVEFDAQHERALALGARVLRDRSTDPEEPLRVYADPSGHPFCIFVADPTVA